MAYQPQDRSPSGIVFFGTNSTDQVFESVSTLVYDSGNNRLGINNAVPGGSLHVDNLQLNGNTLSTTNTNGSLILNPNGNGAIQADSGGNTRGTKAVDLQRIRANASQVASGSCSFIGNGSNNTASNSYSTVVNGNYNCVTGSWGFIGGGDFNCVAGNGLCGLASSIVGGNSNYISSSSDFSFIGGGASNCSCNSMVTIGGGQSNSASGYGSVIAGGDSNIVSQCYSTAGGGYLNRSLCSFSTVSGGCCNSSCHVGSTVSGGYQNCSVGCLSSVGGGKGNNASGAYAVIAGGRTNSAISSYATVGGGNANSASAYGSTVSGGYRNQTNAVYSSVSGGKCNIANARYSTINGGHRNIIQTPTNECCSRGATIGGGVGHNTSGGTLNNTSGDLTGTITCCNAGRFSTIGGGLRNCALEICSTIAGGAYNSINVDGQNGFIGGGTSNQINGPDGVIGGGNNNITYGTASVVVGGYSNVACTAAFIGNGYCNSASGWYAVVAGGSTNTISGDYSSIVGGYRNSLVSSSCSFIGGGYCNTASSNFSTVGGGEYNIASGVYSSILGGKCNIAGHTNSHIIGSGITSSAADTLYTNKICANNTITGTSIIKSGGTSSEFLKADGSVDSTGYTTCVGTVTGLTAGTAITVGTGATPSVAVTSTCNTAWNAKTTCTGTVTSVSAGNGMNFSAISTTGSVVLGTPSSITLSSTDSVSANSHTHAFAPGGTTAEYIRGNGSLATFPTNIASGIGSAGHIAFWTATNSLSYDNNELFWDQTNNRLGIGTNGPSYELDVDGSGRFTGTLNINGDLIVNGTTTTVNSTVVEIQDPIIILGSGTPTTDDNKDRGIAFNYYDGSAKTGFFGYDDNEQKFTFMTNATIAGEVVSGTVGTIKANLVGNVTGNADTATLATDASGLTSAVTIQLGGQLSGSDTFQDAGDTATITASLTSNAITDQAEITSVDGTNDHILIYDSGVGLRKVTPQNFIDDLNIVTSFNVSDGTTSVTVEQGETLSFADGTGAEFVVTNNAGQPTITVNSVDSEIVHDNLSGFVGNEHIDHTTVSILGGSGLLNTGGDITTSRTLHVGAGNGITVAADSVSLASTVAGSGLNYANGVLNIGAGSGIGISSTTIGLTTTGVTAASYGSASSVAAFTVDANGRLTAASNTAISITASQVSNFDTASESAIFTNANFVDSSTVDFTVTAGASVTAVVIANSISETHLKTSVAGNGLTGGNGSPLAVGAGSLIDVQADVVDVDLTEAAAATIAAGDYIIFLDGGTSGAASKGSINDVTTLLAGNGLVTNGAALDINVDGSTIEINSDTLRVKDGGITEAKLSRTVDASFLNNDVIDSDINLVSGGAGGITVKLPAPAIGKLVYVKKIDSAVGAVTVARNGTSDSIDGATQKILYSQYESMSFVSDGTHWYIV